MKRKSTELLVLILYCTLLESCGLSSEAQKVAQQAMDKKVRRCGNSYFTKRPGQNWFWEIKDFHWKVAPRSLSEADRLNGWEFNGDINFNYSAVREAFGDKCWRNWEQEEYYLNGYMRSNVGKNKNEWKIEPSGVLEAPDCSTISQFPVCAK